MVTGHPPNFEVTQVRGARAQAALRGARFLKSAMTVAQLPRDSAREVAFGGRSNAGKSTLINALGGSAKLARTSKTPGRTRAINCFGVAPGKYLMDLPGYGYARVPRGERERWDRELARYFGARASLAGLILLMDVRHPLTPLDRQMIELTRGTGLALHCVLSKADKLGRGAGAAARRGVLGALREAGLEASAQLFSAPRRAGIEECLEVLEGWLELGA